MKKLNQMGFGIWELLLLLLLILLLILLGWWVWKQKGDNKPADNSAPAQSEPKKATGEKPSAEKPKEVAKKYLEIKELGVKVELDDTTSDAYYVMQNGYAYVSTTALKNASTECAAEKTGIVAISKAAKGEYDEMLGKTFEQHIKDGGSGVVIGNNVYLMTRSQAYCSEKVDVQTKQQAAWNSFLAKAKTMQAL